MSRHFDKFLGPYDCPLCGKPYSHHELLTWRPPRWLCPGGSSVVMCLASGAKEVWRDTFSV